jgi:hypothetical protein
MSVRSKILAMTSHSADLFGRFGLLGTAFRACRVVVGTLLITPLALISLMLFSSLVPFSGWRVFIAQLSGAVFLAALSLAGVRILIWQPTQPTRRVGPKLPPFSPQSPRVGTVVSKIIAAFWRVVVAISLTGPWVFLSYSLFSSLTLSRGIGMFLSQAGAALVLAAVALYGFWILVWPRRLPIISWPPPNPPGNPPGGAPVPAPLKPPPHILIAADAKELPRGTDETDGA